MKYITMSEIRELAFGSKAGLKIRKSNHSYTGFVCVAWFGGLYGALNFAAKIAPIVGRSLKIQKDEFGFFGVSIPVEAPSY